MKSLAIRSPFCAWDYLCPLLFRSVSLRPARWKLNWSYILVFLSVFLVHWSLVLLGSVEVLCQADTEMSLELQEIFLGERTVGGKRRDPNEMQGHQSWMQAWPLWRSLRKIGRVSGCMYFKGRFVQADEWPWGPPHTLEESHFCILQEQAGLAFPVGLYLGLNISFGRCGWDMNVVVESQHSSWVPVNHASCSRRLEGQISIARLLRTVKIRHLRTGQSSRKKRRK